MKGFPTIFSLLYYEYTFLTFAIYMTKVLKESLLLRRLGSGPCNGISSLSELDELLFLFMEILGLGMY